MSTRVRLGRTELSVSPICYGSWQLSPKFWGKVPESDAIAAMRGAFDAGVNFFDTADAYGDGFAEEVVGRALATLPRDKVVLATKVFHHFFPDGHRFPDLSHDYILQACENSLKRLKMDYIDLYQCHSWDPLTDPAATTEALEKLKRQGKIRHYGTSNWSVEHQRLGAKYGNYASAQPMYSLLKRNIENDVLPYCQANDIGTLVYSPLHNGLLSGKYKGTETFDDFRKDSADFKGDRFKTICSRMAQVSEIANGYRLSTVQLVLAVTLMHPGITCAIAGIKNPQQIADAAGAMGKTVSREDAYKVRNLLSV